MKKIYYTDISNIKYEDINLSLISSERLTKSNMFDDEIKKIQSLTAYLLLRNVCKELGINITNHEFIYDLFNKPYLKDLTVKFNISHSKNIVCCVVDTIDVGVDCQYIDSNRDFNKIIKYTLTYEEYNEYLKLDEEEKINYFYQKWVMKEAHFKMIGKGLTKDFKSLSLDYQTFKITDSLNNYYYISSSLLDTCLSKKEFNEINQ